MAARRARDALFLLLDRHERSRFRPVSARQCALDQCQFRRYVVARRPSRTGTADPGNPRADSGRHDNPDPRRSPLGQAGPGRGGRGPLSGRGSVPSRFRSNVGDGSSRFGRSRDRDRHDHPSVVDYRRHAAGANTFVSAQRSGREKEAAIQGGCWLRYPLQKQPIALDGEPSPHASFSVSRARVWPKSSLRPVPQRKTTRTENNPFKRRTYATSRMGIGWSTKRAPLSPKLDGTSLSSSSTMTMRDCEKESRFGSPNP